jgi:hypothetical protein
VRRAKTLAFAVLMLLAMPRRGEAQATHRLDQRVAHIQRALQSVQSTPPDALRQANEYARALARGACSSSVQRLKVECLMTAARRWCRNQSDAQRCAASMDVILSNVLGEAQLVPTDKRYQIMTRSKDYRRELAREIRRIQGALAVDFRLRMGDADGDAQLAERMDQYCLASADETGLAWQTCVASLVWFIASERGTESRSSL